MSFDRLKPFNDLPELPPQFTLETHAILKKVIEAHRALADVKRMGFLLPDQAILIQTLGLREAKMSSEIENIVTTNDELYKAYSDQNNEMMPETLEVLHYQKAIWHGFNAMKNNRLLTTSLFEELCQYVNGNTSGIRKTGGTKLANQEGKIMYTPPEGENIIRAKLHNLEKFIYEQTSPASTLDPLIKLALIHYQFESIHPFYDGNGRTGRIINILYLIEEKLLDLPILYLSGDFLNNTADYYNGLRNVTEHSKWLEWIEFFLNAIINASVDTKNRIKAIHELMESTSLVIQQQLPKIYSKELFEVLFERPYCKIRFLEEAKIAQRQTASQYLKQLEEIGVLKTEKAGREKYYYNENFLKILS